MISLFHGDDIETSRLKLNEWKAKHAGMEIRTFDSRTIDAAMLTGALESSSLFGAGHAVIIENLTSKLGKKTKLASQLCSLVALASSDTEIVLWEEKEVTAAAMKQLGTHVIPVLCKTPPIIFQFLDALRPGNAKQTLILFRQLNKQQQPEITFSLLVRRVRLLLQIVGRATPIGMQAWQISRLTKQAGFFTMEQLRMIEQKLLEIEYSIKTGASPFSLSEHIEQFLISLHYNIYGSLDF
ncbi:MAG: hypothetical protein AAB457_00405 [Patescibacteria group bacterium]